MINEKPLRFAVLGCGFWAQYQIAAWRELAGAELVAVCDTNAQRAAATAQRFKVPYHTTDAAVLLAQENLNFVDIITPPAAHAEDVALAARYSVAAITQKPMAPDFETAQRLVALVQQAGIPCYVHENFRWQAPLRRIKTLLEDGAIGPVFKARLWFCSAFPVFANQPALAALEQFILTDIGAHLFDVARFLLGEVATLFCLTRRVNTSIRGEDVANVLLEMQSGAHCFVELSYASLLEREVFPQTLALLEGQSGSLRLAADGEISLTTRGGTAHECVKPFLYDWIDPAYALVQSSIVACNRNLLAGLRGEGIAETTAADNLKTLQLVFAAYDSAREKSVIRF